MGYWTRKVRRCSSYRSVIAWPELPSSRWDRMWLSSTMPTAPRASVPVYTALDAVPTGRRGSAQALRAVGGGTTTRQYRQADTGRDRAQPHYYTCNRRRSEVPTSHLGGCASAASATDCQVSMSRLAQSL